MSAHNLAVVFVPTLFQTMNPDLLRLTREFIIHHTLLFLVNITNQALMLLQSVVSLSLLSLRCVSKRYQTGWCPWPIRIIYFMSILLHSASLLTVFLIQLVSRKSTHSTCWLNNITALTAPCRHQEAKLEIPKTRIHSSDDTSDWCSAFKGSSGERMKDILFLIFLLVFTAGVSTAAQLPGASHCLWPLIF